MDNTLALVANAGQSRGLPRDVLRNLALMQPHALRSAFLISRLKWNPGLNPESREYQVRVPEPGTKEFKAQELKLRLKRFVEDAYNPVGEAIKLAEGRHKLTLGRLHKARNVP